MCCGRAACFQCFKAGSACTTPLTPSAIRFGNLAVSCLDRGSANPRLALVPPAPPYRTAVVCSPTCEYELRYEGVFVVFQGRTLLGLKRELKLGLVGTLSFALNSGESYLSDPHARV